ncbi:unnamed protein product [Brassica napus]|uniref:(rape) hypothetical protein n=1 Tax=Brassica napus TaxID=3708 RepID=A0A816JJK3_BRANA|nr:unnamed protein product [Brassica napus]
MIKQKGKKIKKKKLKGKSLKSGSKKRRKRKLPKIITMSLRLRRIEPMKLQHHHVGIRRRELPYHHVVGLRQWLCCGRGCGNRGKKQQESCRRREKEEETVKEQAGEIVEEYIEEEKQRWIMVVYKEAPNPWIMHRCKENAAVAVPKKSDKPKRKSQWVQTPFTERKKRKTKP